MNIFNKIKTKLNHHLNDDRRLNLLHSEFQVDSHEECMVICNRIIDAIRSLTTLKERFYGLFEYFVPVIERVEISDIDTNEKRMNVLNKIIEAVNGLGKISLSSFLLFEFIFLYELPCMLYCTKLSKYLLGKTTTIDDDNQGTTSITITTSRESKTSTFKFISTRDISLSTSNEFYSTSMFASSPTGDFTPPTTSVTSITSETSVSKDSSGPSARPVFTT